jgi:uncharacterized glyoxalase superfamily protein PhnB
MPEFKSIVPVLIVTDMQRAVDFYKEVLGFEVCWRGRRTEAAKTACWPVMQPINLLLSTGSQLGGEPQATVTLYFNMTGVRGFFEKVMQNAVIVWPLEMMDSGQLEFGIRDRDGYLLAFAEAVNDR